MKEVARLQAILKERIPEGLVMARHTETEHFYEYTPIKEVFPSVTAITGIVSSGHLKQWAVNEGLRYLGAHWNEITPENRAEYFKAAQMAHVSTFEDAGDIGTRVHGIIEKYLDSWIETGIQPDDIKKFILENDSRLFAATRSAELFFNDFHVVPIISEMRLAHPRHKYGGTVDALMFVGTVLNEGHAGRTGFAKCSHLWSESRKGKQVECFHCGRKLKMTLTLCDWKSSNNIDHDGYAEQLSAYERALYALTGIRPKDLFVIRLDKFRAKYEVARVTDRRAAFRSFLHTKKKYDWMNDGVTKLYPVIEREVIKIT